MCESVPESGRCCRHRKPRGSSRWRAAPLPASVPLSAARVRCCPHYFYLCRSLHKPSFACFPQNRKQRRRRKGLGGRGCTPGSRAVPPGRHPCTAAQQSHPSTSTAAGLAPERDSGGQEGAALAPCPWREAWLGRPCGRCRPPEVLAPWSSLWSVDPAPVWGTVGSGLFLVSMWGVLRLHTCTSLLCARAQRSTMGMGTSEPYLLFLKKSLIAFCNCTVDKCSKST